MVFPPFKSWRGGCRSAFILRRAKGWKRKAESGRRNFIDVFSMVSRVNNPPRKSVQWFLSVVIAVSFLPIQYPMTDLNSSTLLPSILLAGSCAKSETVTQHSEASPWPFEKTSPTFACIRTHARPFSPNQNKADLFDTARHSLSLVVRLEM